MAKKPNPNENNDNFITDEHGRKVFAKGNTVRLGQSNPIVAKTNQLRQALFDAITCGDFQAIIKSIKRKAKKGDVIAANCIFDRTLGKPAQLVDLGQDTAQTLAAFLGKL